MFLYFSKLLPLFIYPLGLSCLLLILAFITLWKRPRLAALSIVLALLLLLMSSNSWISNHLVKSLEWQNLPTPLPQAGAIVVLGGATRPQVYPRPSVDIMEEGDRVLYGAALYRQGKAPLVILSGGRTMDLQQASSSESQDMAILMQQMGVPATAILQDPTSLNTYENAVNVKKILRSHGIQRVLLVTSALHMPRSL
ncbi:MAG TPA: YdcF family protein [Coleofasciculaceae cyanobacterium]